MENLLSGKKILLYTHELSYTGAPTSLLRICKVLQEYRCILEVWSAQSGDYWKEFDARNIPVKIVSAQNLSDHIEEMQFFDLAIANTIVSWQFYDICRKYIPTIWYIREAQAIPKYFVKNHYWESIFKTADELFCVSEYAAKFIYKNYNHNVRIVQNCVEDFYNPHASKSSVKFPIKILMLGSLTERKGFKVAIEALLALDENYKNKISISFGGQIIRNDRSNKYVKELLEDAEKYPNIQYLGEIQDKATIMHLYEDCDIILVPSQDESCSLVTLEGAMQAKALIVSENVGAKYMVTEKNGWIFPTDNIEALRDIFIKAILMKDQLLTMGLESRKRYIELASMDYYRSAIYDMVSEKLRTPYSEAKKFEYHQLSYRLLKEYSYTIENRLKENQKELSDLKKKVTTLQSEKELSSEENQQKISLLESELAQFRLTMSDNFYPYYADQKQNALKIISNSPLFDANWYKSQYPDVYASPEAHYWSFGWKKGYDPSLFFSTNYYLEQNHVTICPLVHYELSGKIQKCKIAASKLSDNFFKQPEVQISIIESSKLFNAKWYAKKYLRKSNIRASEHYLTNGWKNGFDPSPHFSSDAYIEANPEVQKNLCPLLHYEITGKYLAAPLSLPHTSKIADDQIVIVLASPKKELNSTRRCLRSLINQSLQCHKIVLSLNNEEFPLREKDIPIPLLDLCKSYGITIIWSSKREFNAIIQTKEAFPNAILVTVNNLISYKKTWLEQLYHMYKQHPNFVYCYAARKIITKGSAFFLAPLNEGLYQAPTFLNLIIGRTVLFPPNWKPNIDKSFCRKYVAHNINYWYWKSCVVQGYRIQVISDDSVPQDKDTYVENLFEEDEFNNIISHFPQIGELVLENERELDINKKIKLVVPARPRNIEYNGDYHYAVALKNEFVRRGYDVDLRLIDDWYKPFDGKYVIVIRGPFAYKCSSCHYNIMWNISHPEDISIGEYASYDAVFIASKKWTCEVNKRLSTFGSQLTAQTLLQCTDANVFGKFNPDSHTFRDILFCGMRHTEGRKIVEDLLPTNFNFCLYGPRWDGHIPVSFHKGEVIPNNALPQYYHYSAITLNDTRPEMRMHGFVSNRIFDILAAGGFAISDYMDEITDIFGDTVVMYNGTHDDLTSKITFYLENDEIRRHKISKGRQLVLKNHTFRNRVDQFLKLIEE